MVSKPMVDCWLEIAQEEKATHLIVVLDVTENDTFPVYVYKGQNVEFINKLNNTGVNKVLEIYNMNMDIEIQYNSNRAFNL